MPQNNYSEMTQVYIYKHSTHSVLCILTGKSRNISSTKCFWSVAKVQQLGNDSTFDLESLIPVVPMCCLMAFESGLVRLKVIDALINSAFLVFILEIRL